MSTAISNPVSLTNLNPGSVVSNLEDALMKSIGQGVQSGQSTDNASLHQEMQLLTELLNQSDNNESPTTQNSSAPLTISGDPSTNGSDPSASTAPSSASSNPSTSTSSSTNSNSSTDKTERKLERALERNVTDRLQAGQTPSDDNALQQEMQLLIKLLAPGA